MEDVFARLKARMLEGMVFHDEMSRYYDFLGMSDMREKHRCHYADETEGYIKLCEYYIYHFGKLIPQTPMNRPDVIPDSWYMYSRQDVDASTRRNAMRSGAKMWVAWESETKDLYEDCCGELLNNGEIASAYWLMDYIKDVDDELAGAHELLISVESQ